MNAFGNTPIGIIVLDVILLIFGGILIPLMWKIFNALNDQLSQSKLFTHQIGNLCETIKEITTELTSSRERDIGFQRDIDNIKEILTDHIREEREK